MARIKAPRYGPQRDLLLLQYQISSLAREHMKIAGRITFTFLMLVVPFVPSPGAGMAFQERIFLQSVVLYGPFILGLVWFLDDRRRSLTLRDLEELLQRVVTLRSLDENEESENYEYVRARYRQSITGLRYEFILQRYEPLIWTSLVIFAVSFHFILLNSHYSPL